MLEIGRPRFPQGLGVVAEHRAPVLLNDRDRHVQLVARLPIGLIVFDVDACRRPVIGNDRRHRLP